MNSYIVKYLIVWLLAPSFQDALGQKINGVYKGKLGNENSILELKSSNDLLLGIVYKGSDVKWYFSATYDGIHFAGNPTIGLIPDIFIRGIFNKDSVILAITAPDSTYEGKFVRESKKKGGKVVDQVFSGRASLDSNLVGEWICVDGSAPVNISPINWRISYLENGTVILDDASIKADVEKLFTKHSVKRKVVIPKMNITWRTEGDRLIATLVTEFGTSETINSYELRGDTLLTTCTLSGFTSIFIRYNNQNKLKQ